MMMIMILIFFFKQKTAYEMRISDWSSDVCSSDLMMEVQKQQGRADKVAAQSLLAKVYLTMASSRMTGSPGYEWVQDYEATYEQAAKYAYEVLYGQGVYGLDPDLARV